MIAERYVENATLTDIDIKHLLRCIERPREALAASDLPFRTLLLIAVDEVQAEDCMQIQQNDNRAHHPEQPLT